MTSPLHHAGLVVYSRSYTALAVVPATRWQGAEVAGEIGDADVFEYDHADHAVITGIGGQTAVDAAVF